MGKDNNRMGASADAAPSPPYAANFGIGPYADGSGHVVTVSFNLRAQYFSDSTQIECHGSDIHVPNERLADLIAALCRARAMIEAAQPEPRNNPSVGSPDMKELGITPDQRIAAYLAAYEAANGRAHPGVTYRFGWYDVASSHGRSTPFRARQIEEFTARLVARARGESQG